MAQENLICVPDKIFRWPYAKSVVSSSVHRVRPQKKARFQLRKRAFFAAFENAKYEYG